MYNIAFAFLFFCFL